VLLSGTTNSNVSANCTQKLQKVDIAKLDLRSASWLTITLAHDNHMTSGRCYLATCRTFHTGRAPLLQARPHDLTRLSIINLILFRIHH